MQSGYDERKEGCAQNKACSDAADVQDGQKADVMASEMNPPKGINTTYVTIPVINSETVGVTMISSD